MFYRLDSVQSHLVFAEHHPLNLGMPMDQVAVFWVTRPVPADRLPREDVARVMINVFVLQRLVPFGCFRAALDDEGRVCIARGHRYDAYFGRELARPYPASAATIAARVVVQPDFSVMVIGPNLVPLAELAPFCDRTTRGGSQGAMVLKITRDSVVKGGQERPDTTGDRRQAGATRRQRRAGQCAASSPGWSTWVRRVTASSLIALRCPGQ